jgi:hypothetical protein
MKLFAVLLRIALVGYGLTRMGQSQTFTVQQPNCQIFLHFTALNQSVPTAPNAGLDNRTTGCTTWNMAINVTGFTSVTVALQSAPDNNGVPGAFVTYANATIISAAPHNANPIVTGTQDFVWIVGYNPWVRARLTAVTGSGTVNGGAFGWNIPSAGAAATASQNVVIVGPLGQALMAASIPVTIASNQSALSVQGGAAVGAAPVGNPVPPGLIDGSGNIITPDYCTKTATFGFTAASGSVQMVAVSGSTTIRVCHVSFSGDTVTNLKIVNGTGATCTSPANETGTYQQVLGFAFDWSSPLITTAAKTICLNSSASVTGGGTIIYSQR